MDDGLFDPSMWRGGPVSTLRKDYGAALKDGESVFDSQRAGADWKEGEGEVPLPKRPASVPVSSILVAGAAGRLGSELLDALAADPGLSGATLTAHARGFVDFTDRDAAFTYLAAVRPDAVVSCLGRPAEAGKALDYSADIAAARNLIDAAAAAGVRRFVLLSALGARRSQCAPPAQVAEGLREFYNYKSLVEKHLLASCGDMVWTVLRPGPLADGAARGTPVVTEYEKCFSEISRGDLAATVVAVLQSAAAGDSVLSVLDSQGILITSPYVRPFEPWEALPFEEYDLA